jgi:hypothetical protein
MSNSHDLPAEVVRLHHPALMQVPKVCYAEELLFEALTVLLSTAMMLLRDGQVAESNTCMDTLTVLLHHDPEDFGAAARELMAIGFTVSAPAPVFFFDCSIKKDEQEPV